MPQKNSLNKIRTVFFGSSDFSKIILQGLMECGNYDVLALISQPDKPSGRKQLLEQSEIVKYASALGITSLQPQSLKSGEIAAQLRILPADVYVIAAYGKIIPQNILDLPKYGAVNVHASLLPMYRGASPIQSAIRDGKTVTGISIMLMDAKMDHGPILAQKELKIEPNDMYADLEKKLANLGQILLINTLISYINGHITPKPQEHQAATYCKLLAKSDGQINWSDSAAQIYNQFRAYACWPGIWAIFNDRVLKINDCAVASVPEKLIAAPGTVFSQNKKIFVCCGQGALEILEVQLAGKKSQTVPSFINGHKGFIGSVLR